MYDLDNTKDHFVFKINQKEYKMTFPTVSQLEEIQQMATSKSDASEQEKLEMGQKVQQHIYSFIKPVDPEAEKIEHVVKNMNVITFKKFNEMIQTEFGV